jgi:diacylglycerol kinase (CTP)
MARSQIPAIPRVISPSPTPSESQENSQEWYFEPVTRSSTRNRVSTPSKIDEAIDGEDSDTSPDQRRARSKSRSPMRVRKMSGLSKSKPTAASLSIKTQPTDANCGTINGHLSLPSTSTGWSWRDLSRSPSPLGLIPIHRQWRSFVHRHEVPRKFLHVSIGFLTIWAYISGVQTNQITPYLIAGLIPVATADYLRFKLPSFNRFYVRVLGALMRETEYNSWNGVIWYLLGAWIVLTCFPKDVGAVGVLLLSWCDTAASTFGRAYGRYTPRIRKGKSVAGSFAALVVGVVVAASFWGWLALRPEQLTFDADRPFMFNGILRLPGVVREALGLTEAQGRISGGLALTVMSLWTGLIASISEAVDIFSWDDNLTIPVLSGIGIWGFLKIFG